MAKNCRRHVEKIEKKLWKSYYWYWNKRRLRQKLKRDFEFEIKNCEYKKDKCGYIY